MDETGRLITNFLVQFLRLMLVPVGAVVAILSGLGIVGNYSEWETHFCRGPQLVYPVCGSIYWLIVELFIFASIGVVLVYVGLGARFQSIKPRLV